jgi:hypothetical protein
MLPPWLRLCNRKDLALDGRQHAEVRGAWVGGDHAEVAATHSRSNRDGLHLPRFAAWGSIGGLLLSALFVRGASLGWGEVLAISTTFALASAACASGSLAVARRAVRRELPDIGGDTAEAELADHEKRKLL